MNSKTRTRYLLTAIAAAVSLCWVSEPGVFAQTAPTAQSKREAAKTRVKTERQKLQDATGAAGPVTATTQMIAPQALAARPPGFQDYSIPHYANSPALAKFVDALPGLCTGADAPGTCIPIAKKIANPLFPNDDYYELGVFDYTQQMHRDLSVTHLRGYRDLNPNASGKNSYLGPIIVAERNKPVRVKFVNSKTPDGKHIIPVDTTVMGAGPFEIGDLAQGTTTVGNFGENRSGIHLHGGFTPWISDGTPHQWVSPVGEVGDYKEGVSLAGVPDMEAVGNGVQTLFYPNQQSSRLMFYHDHAYGITRLNVYAGEAAGYVLTDKTEQDLITAGTLPGLGVPLIIQDKTFVHPGTVLTDPTWIDVAPGSATAPGDLWFPHVYVPNQDPYNYSGIATSDGMNPKGRWDYGPWIWPPVTVQVPETLPNPSIVPEAFMDTMVVNGKAFPFFNVNKAAYRFRVLNASNDRFLNLQLYYAVQNTAQGPTKCDRITGNTNPTTAGVCTEVAMVPRDGVTYTVNSPGEVAVPSTVPDDGFRGSVPDPRNAGPKMIQIGNEGGFLPKAIERNHPPVPITYDTDPKSMTVGNVKEGTIILGPAERADIVIDFSQVPRGSTLILYNDAPAAFPAGDARYDYFTGNEDLTANGGAAPTVAGKGPNTRTVMQFRVNNQNVNPAAFNFAALADAIRVAYANQDPPHVPQPEYPLAGMPAGNQYATLFNTTSFTFVDAAGNTQTLPIHQKAIAEEFDTAYGRMSANLGTEAMVTGNQGQNTFGFFYVDPSTENLPAGVTQIWKITHNGVDTHAIHWHLLNVQVINRVDWAGVIKGPDPDELGWKETLRMNPLEDIIVAVQAKAPALPSTWAPLPDSVRPRDVTQPLGSMMSFTQPWPYEHTPANQQPVEFPVEAVNPVTTMNEMANYGWEYVWHCHLLGHEENDMMRPLVMTQVSSALDTIAPVASAALSPAPNAAGWNKAPSVSLVLTATDTGGSNVASIEYSTDLGATWLPYSAPVAFSTETPLAGSIVQSRATDGQGNVSPVVSTTVKLDLTAPTFTQAPSVAKLNTNQVTISGAATDALSGLVTGAGAGTYSLSGPSPSAGSFSIATNGTFSFGRTKLKNGNYTATIIVKDVAGNAQTATVTFIIP